MEKKTIDARGLSCPMPVVMVKNEVDKTKPDAVDVMVDSMVCVENLKRFAGKYGYRVEVKEEGADYHLTLEK